MFQHTNFSKNLRNLTPLGQDLEKVATLLGVRKVLNLEDLEFPTLLDESDDRESIVLEYCAIMESEQARSLCRGYPLYIIQDIKDLCS